MPATVNKTENMANSRAMSDAEIDRAMAKMGDEIKGQPKETIRIPINPYEPDGQPQYVALNGYSLYIPRGKSVQVPRPIAEILRNQGVI